MKAIVTGMIASYPVGGVAWDYGQYALGLERLGFEVFYLEDTGWQTYDPRHGEYGEDCSYGVEFLARTLADFSPSLARRWRFRSMDGRGFGMSEADFAEALDASDLFLNVSGGTLLRPEYLRCQRKVLIDTDPGWNHFRNYPRWDRQPNWHGTHGFRAHDFFFTYAERLGKPGCILPDLGLAWQPTRPPVVLDAWKREAPGTTWTTVMTWKNFHETIEYQGVKYGTKEMEFEKIARLPAHVHAPIEIALGGAKAPVADWQKLGWRVIKSDLVSQTAAQYRQYIQSSRGELSVAKNVYVATRCGWFSCRSVCYLAAGLPVVVQDTGFSEVFPVGEGLFSFADLTQAIAALQAVEADYDRHQRAARALAENYFAAEIVLGDLLRRIGL
ncbi:MAG: glycosyltransferase family 1 protein [Verrucomicrobiota bacterium]